MKKLFLLILFLFLSFSLKAERYGIAVVDCFQIDDFYYIPIDGKIAIMYDTSTEGFLISFPYKYHGNIIPIFSKESTIQFRKIINKAVKLAKKWRNLKGEKKQRLGTISLHIYTDQFQSRNYNDLGNHPVKIVLERTKNTTLLAIIFGTIYDEFDVPAVRNGFVFFYEKDLKTLAKVISQKYVDKKVEEGGIK